MPAISQIYNKAMLDSAWLGYSIRHFQLGFIMAHMMIESHDLFL